MKLSPQHKQILKIHGDFKFHCSTVIEFIRDQRKRISELNLNDFDGVRYSFESEKCDGRCGKIHSSNLVMRRLVFNSHEPQKTFCCGAKVRGEDTHSRDCKIFQLVERKINVLF